MLRAIADNESQMTAEMELELIERWQQCRDADARDALLRAQLRLVMQVVYKYRRRLDDDIVQEACIGVLRAIDKFDSTRGTRLATVAKWWALHMVTKAMHHERSLIRVPLRHEPKVCYSLHTSSSRDGATRLDLLRDESAEAAFVAREEAEEEARLATKVQAALGRLSSRNRNIVERRLMADEPETLVAIGADMGLCRERVRQLQERAMAELRGSLDTVYE
jgi:RNA polymerase sigma-32 factor